MDYIEEKIQNNSGKRLDMLKARSKRCLCKYCGGELRVRQIVYTAQEEARIELFCKDCDRIEFGVEPEIYNNARFYVEESGFNCFPDLDDNIKTKQMTIAKVCEIIQWQNQNIGILNHDGYAVDLKPNHIFGSECIVLTDEELDREL